MLSRSKVGKSILQFTLPTTTAYQVKSDSFHKRTTTHPGLSSIQEEADTKMISHCYHQTTTHPI